MISVGIGRSTFVPHVLKIIRSLCELFRKIRQPAKYPPKKSNALLSARPPAELRGGGVGGVAAEIKTGYATLSYPVIMDPLCYHC